MSAGTYWVETTVSGYRPTASPGGREFGKFGVGITLTRALGALQPSSCRLRSNDSNEPVVDVHVLPHLVRDVALRVLRGALAQIETTAELSALYREPVDAAGTVRSRLPQTAPVAILTLASVVADLGGVKHVPRGLVSLDVYFEDDRCFKTYVLGQDLVAAAETMMDRGSGPLATGAVLGERAFSGAERVTITRELVKKEQDP